MKKITAPILVAMLACQVVHSQQATVDSPAGTHEQTVVTATDSATVTESTETLALIENLDENEPLTPPVVGVKDGKWTVEYGGESYTMSSLVDDASFADKYRDLENLDADTLILKDNMGMATIIIAIIFGVPCLTIIVGLIVILVYSLKRNKGRNELINNAIDHDYQLPDAFYLGQKNSGNPSTPTRDSKKFYSATTLLAVGLALMIYAGYVDTKSFILAGGIPFLIGVGQLVGYFCVPSTPRGRYPYYGLQQWPSSDNCGAPQPPYQNNQPQYPGQQPQYPGSQPQCPGQQPPYMNPRDSQTPPPFNPGNPV